jgi:4-amino-4-deoxy-L-arabinose transferase-like glycosyltransferase
MNPHSRSGPTEVRPAMLFVAAAAIRAMYLVIYHPPLESYYLGLADNLLNTGVLGFDGIPSTAFEPVYPFFLAAGRLLFGQHTVLIQVLQACVAAAGATLVYYLALELSGSRRVATAAAALFALHPLLIRQASAASDLAVTTTLLIGFALAFVRIRDAGSAAAAGLLLGVTVLTRSMVLPVLVLAAGILAARRRPREAAVLMIVTAVLVTPMAARNYALSGSPWPGRSGINLYIGNSPYTAALLPTYDLDLLQPKAYARFVRARPDLARDDREFEAEFERFLTGHAIGHMVENPWATLRQKALNVLYLLSPRLVPFEVAGAATRVRIEGHAVTGVHDSVPRPRSEIVAHAVTSTVLLIGCAAGVYLRRHELQRDAILWGIFITFVIVNVVYVPATRYSAPMQFVLIFYSAVALARLRETLMVKR